MRGVRTRIVQCRLDEIEFERFAPLVRLFHHKTWSTLIRTALQNYWQAGQSRASDNAVIQNGHETKQRQARPSVVSKRYRPSLPAAKKTQK